MYTDLLREEKIQVLAHDHEVLIRSGFSRTHDLVWRIFKVANEGAFLIPRDLPLDEGVDYFYPNIHYGNDDYPAMALKHYVYLSGNHGSVWAVFIHSPGHAFTEQDIGALFTNEKGEEFVLVSVYDKDHILIHGVGKGNTANPLFPGKDWTKLYHKGVELPLEEKSFTQLFPCNRVTKYEYLIDGKIPLEKNKIYTCSTLEFHFDHDVVSPLHLAAFLRDNAGKGMKLPAFQQHARMCFAHTQEGWEKVEDFMKLPALLTQKNIFTFQSSGCYTNKRNITFHQELEGVSALDVMQIWNEYMSERETEEFYIPKLKDLTLQYRDGTPHDLWKSNQVFPCRKTMKLNQMITRDQDALDPTDPPDRYIRLVGTTSKREIGFALGYSLVNGFTAKENKGRDRNELYYFYQSKKFYPRSYSFPSVKPGKTMEIHTYKHYFDPDREPDATSFYYHRDGESFVVYLDFHKKLENKKIRLPESFAGKKITIVESTPGIALHTKEAIPAKDPEIALDVNDSFGYLVLKLD